MGSVRSMTLVLLVAVVAAALGLAGGAFAASPAEITPFGFELDGNVVQDSAGPTPYDWANLFDAGGGKLLAPNPDGPLLQSGFTTDPVNTTSDDIFTGVGSKDTEGFSLWRSTASKPQAKDDIENFYAGMFRVPGDLANAGDNVLVAGLDRFDNSGDSRVGIWAAYVSRPTDVAAWSSTIGGPSPMTS